MSSSPMLKPAGARRKSKPDLIGRASRFAPTLRAMCTPTATSNSATRPWRLHARRRSTRRRARHGASPTGAASWAITTRAGGLADRRRVHQAALRPQVVDAARQADRCLGAQVALEALAVVAHLLDDAVGPLLVEPEQLAGVFRDAEEALHARVLVGRLVLVDVGLREPFLLGLEHREQRPAHDLE